MCVSVVPYYSLYRLIRNDTFRCYCIFIVKGKSLVSENPVKVKRVVTDWPEWTGNALSPVFPERGLYRRCVDILLGRHIMKYL